MASVEKAAWVVGTSNDTEAWATYPGGGVYTRGLVEGLRDEETDGDDPPDGVDPDEADENGRKAISENNRKQGKAQEPWEAGRKCDCKCPCKPDIDVDKWVMGGDVARWENEVEVEPGSLLRFRIEIENTGKCRDLVDLQFIDEMAGCLELPAAQPSMSAALLNAAIPTRPSYPAGALSTSGTSRMLVLSRRERSSVSSMTLSPPNPAPTSTRVQPTRTARWTTATWFPTLTSRWPWWLVKPCRLHRRKRCSKSTSSCTLSARPTASTAGAWSRWRCRHRTSRAAATR